VSQLDSLGIDRDPVLMETSAYGATLSSDMQRGGSSGFGHGEGECDESGAGMHGEGQGQGMLGQVG